MNRLMSFENVRRHCEVGGFVFESEIVIVEHEYGIVLVNFYWFIDVEEMIENFFFLNLNKAS